MTGKRIGARRGAPRRVVPAIWGASAIAAVVLALGVSGTLSTWTSAIITNSANTVTTTSAVILKETGPANQGNASCPSSQDATNSYTCTTINKYGGTAAQFAPGGVQTTDVVFSNVGTSVASSFKLTGGACTSTSTLTAVAGAPTPTNLCTSGDLTVGVSCSPGATYASGTAWSDLVLAPTAPNNLSAAVTLTHAAGLASGASATCRFTLALAGAAPPTAQGVTIVQPLVWTLTQ